MEVKYLDYVSVIRILIWICEDENMRYENRKGRTLMKENRTKIEIKDLRVSDDFYYERTKYKLYGVFRFLINRQEYKYRYDYDKPMKPNLIIKYFFENMSKNDRKILEHQRFLNMGSVNSIYEKLFYAFFRTGNRSTVVNHYGEISELDDYIQNKFRDQVLSLWKNDMDAVFSDHVEISDFKTMANIYYSSEFASFLINLLEFISDPAVCKPRWDRQREEVDRLPISFESLQKLKNIAVMDPIFSAICKTISLLLLMAQHNRTHILETCEFIICFRYFVENETCQNSQDTAKEEIVELVRCLLEMGSNDLPGLYYTAELLRQIFQITSSPDTCRLEMKFKNNPPFETGLTSWYYDWICSYEVLVSNRELFPESFTIIHIRDKNIVHQHLSNPAARLFEDIIHSSNETEYKNKLYEYISPLTEIIGPKIGLKNDLNIDDCCVARTFIDGGNDHCFTLAKTKYGQRIKACMETTILGQRFIARWAGMYYQFHPPIDLSQYDRLEYEARTIQNTIQRIDLEIKPLGKQWNHDTFPAMIRREWQTFTVDLSQVYIETRAKVEEICFVVRPYYFRNEEKLEGIYEIRKLRLYQNSLDKA